MPVAFKAPCKIKTLCNKADTNTPRIALSGTIDIEPSVTCIDRIFYRILLSCGVSHESKVGGYLKNKLELHASTLKGDAL